MASKDKITTIRNRDDFRIFVDKYKNLINILISFLNQYKTRILEIGDFYDWFDLTFSRYGYDLYDLIEPFYIFKNLFDKYEQSKKMYVLTPRGILMWRWKSFHQLLKNF